MSLSFKMGMSTVLASMSSVLVSGLKPQLHPGRVVHLQSGSIPSSKHDSDHGYGEKGLMIDDFSLTGEPDSGHWHKIGVFSGKGDHSVWWWQRQDGENAYGPRPRPPNFIHHDSQTGYNRMMFSIRQDSPPGERYSRLIRTFTMGDGNDFIMLENLAKDYLGFQYFYEKFCLPHTHRGTAIWNNTGYCDQYITTQNFDDYIRPFNGEAYNGLTRKTCTEIGYSSLTEIGYIDSSAIPGNWLYGCKNLRR